jgi:hypothetical protein
MIRGIFPADLIMGMADEDVAKLAVEAYLYGFPLVFNLDQVLRYVTTGVGSNPKAPFNQFSHARTLAGPQDTFVTINNDTLYSMAQLDLSVGPVRLHVPDTDGRYYVLQFVDAWTNNFAYVGHRATGTGEADFLLVPPGWTGQASRMIRTPRSRMIWCSGRNCGCGHRRSRPPRATFPGKPAWRRPGLRKAARRPTSRPKFPWPRRCATGSPPGRPR